MERGAISLLYGRLKEGLVVFADFERSGKERDAMEETRDEVELFSVGEWEK